MLLALLWVFAAPARAADTPNACGEPAAVPAQLQVAWIAPAGERVGAKRGLHVVRVADLRAWAREANPDVPALLKHLGYVPERGGRKARKPWMVTVFDVGAAQLCRPLAGVEPGTVVGGVSACATQLQQGIPGYGGCGYTVSTVDGARGLDHFRVTWEEASKQGFCVLPLERFLEGA